MKKTILILGGSSSIAKVLRGLHQEDDVHYSYHSTFDQQNNAFYLDMYDSRSYQNIPDKEYNIIYSFLGYTPDVNLIEDKETTKATIERNFLYPTLVLQFILQHNLVKQNGRIKIVTSVAGIRGKKLNYVYGASKSGLQTLIEGLANKYREIKFTDIVLGPVFTAAVPLHKTPKFLVSMPLKVAQTIKNSHGARIFVPYRWRIITLIIRCIPRYVYNRITL